MSKNHYFSYEGFRRKNSVNSTQLQKSTSSNELAYLKFRHNEHLTEVENLSMQLDSLSKRSLSSRNLYDERSQLSQSATHFPHPQEEIAQNELYDPLFKDEAISRPRLQMQQNFQKPSVRVRNEKVSTSAVFNKFQPIEQGHLANEQQENPDMIEPITFKCKPSQKLVQKKGTHKLPSTKNLVHPTPTPTAKKPMNFQKVELMGGNKRQKIKLELNELDKMQKQLDSKRNARESNQIKSNNLNLLKRIKQPNILNLKDGKLVKSSFPQNQSKPFFDSPNKTLKSPGNTMATLPEMNYDQGKEECIPTRMLSEKEKMCLMVRVQSLRQIIEKNDICSENLEELCNYFSRIEKLLTK